VRAGACGGSVLQRACGKPRFVGEDATAVELELPAARQSVAWARRAVRSVADGLVADVYAVELAVTEAVTNAIVHAYRGPDHGRDPVVRVAAAVEHDHLRVVVADDGVGMSQRPDSPGLGLGLGLIADAADELHIEQRGPGTRLVMRFTLRGET
jgi:serine/threonine-protein kinase RsbW